MGKDKIKILAINSSPKLEGHTAHFLQSFIRSAEKLGADVIMVNLYKQHLKPFSGKLGIKIKSLAPLQKEMVNADGFVIATPTYWFNEPGVLKNFMDWMTPLEENGFLLEGKVGGFIVYSPQGGETDILENLAIVFNHMGVLLPPYSMIFYRNSADTWVKKDIPLLAKNMIQQIKAQKKLNISWDYD